MNTLLLSIMVGFIIAVMDIIPMIKLKLPRYTIIAAFIHYLMATLVIFQISLPGLPWWLKGSVVGFALMVPMLIHVGHSDKKPLPIITLNAIVLGGLAGFAAHYLS